MATIFCSRSVRTTILILTALLFANFEHAVYDSSESAPLVSTFSIVAYDSANGDLGVAVQSKFPNVRPIVPWAKALPGTKIRSP